MNNPFGGLISGSIKNQKTNTIDSGLFVAENKDSISLIKGTPCTLQNNGIIKSRANDPDKWAIGLIIETVAPTFVGTIQNSGAFVMDDWFVLAGTILLIPRTLYYLGSDGNLINGPLIQQGQILQQIGIAVNTKVLMISIGAPILL